MRIRLIHFLILLVVFCIGSEVWSQETPLQSSIGPFEISNADSSSKIRLQFASQLQMLFDSRDQGSDISRTNKLFMKARRIRLVITGTIIKPSLSYKIHLSTAPHSLEFMDFFFNYKINRQLQFRYGQYKVPFTRYRNQSFQRLTFVDWAIVTKYFGAERQMGLAFHNGYEKPPKWGYVFGVFTGVNARASHAVGLPKFYGVEISNPSDLSNPTPIAEFHPELFLHVGYHANDIRIRSDSDAERGGLRYSVALSAGWDLDPVAKYDFAARLSSELLVKYQGISFLGIGYAGFVKIGNPESTELAMPGGLLQSAYRINQRYEISARYAVIDFRDIIVDDACASIQGLSAEVKDQQVLREQEITLGFTIYLLAARRNTLSGIRIYVV